VALRSGGKPVLVYRADVSNAGTALTWQALPPTPFMLGSGAQAGLAADSANPNKVYIAQGQINVVYAGVYAWDSSRANSWELVSVGGANGTAPHADTRQLLFDAGASTSTTDTAGTLLCIRLYPE